jgi:hypothetical protein
MPVHRMKARDVTEHMRERLCTAEEIWLVDPNHGTGQDNKHPWMELIISVPPPIPVVVDPSAPQRAPVVIEIEIDSTDLEGLVQIRDKVKKVCSEPTIESPHATGVT